MQMSLLEKARAGRLAALASLESPVFDKPVADILPLELDFIAEREMPAVQFVSQRPKLHENLFAA